MDSRTQKKHGDGADKSHHADLKWAVEHTLSCGSSMSCLKHGTCLGRPVCKALGAMGSSAGFVVPTESAETCGYCVPAFRGSVCFCPTRWALYRTEAVPI